MEKGLLKMGPWWAVIVVGLTGLIGFALTYTAFNALASIKVHGTDQDRQQIQQRLRGYFAALLNVEDRASLRQYVHVGVQDIDLERVQRQVQEDGSELVSIPVITVTRDRATATVRLRLRNGAVAERQVLLQRGEDGWRVRDPELRPSP